MKSNAAKKNDPIFVPRREAKIREILGNTFAELQGLPWTGSTAEWPIATERLFNKACDEFREWLSMFD